MRSEATPLDPRLVPAERAIATLAAAYPETHEDNPWGHRVFKVRGKSFLFLAGEGQRLSISVKLPDSGVLALELPFCEPTGYGLGKSGWVSAAFGPGDEVPIGLIGHWLDESFAAIAPKRVVAAWRAAAPVTPKPAAKKSSRRGPG